MWYYSKVCYNKPKASIVCTQVILHCDNIQGRAQFEKTCYLSLVVACWDSVNKQL